MAELTGSGAMASLRQMQGLKDIPLLRQLALFGGVAIAVALGLTMFNWSQKPEYVALYAGLSDKDSSELADALRAANIEYRLDPGSGNVTVPPDQVHAARLRAASQGLPKGGAQGFEMIQGEQGFGVSQFIENARYQLALETELARTVSSLQPVSSARVHLAVPKPSAFTGGNRGAASASVVIELKAGRTLEANQVESIQHIVASSVPNMAPTAVTVIDQFGRLLGSDKRNDEFAESTEQYQFTRRAEADYVRRIESLLAPMVGANRLSAQVAADFDFSVTEEARETYNPQNSVVRSEQTNESQRRDGSSSEAAGIPGSTSNQPPAAVSQTPPADPKTVAAAATTATTATATPPPSQSTRSETRNYELDRTLSHTRQSQGRLKRLSIAVLVDNLTRIGTDGKPASIALTAEELAKVEALAKQAVGFDSARGDTVTVQNAPFVAEAIEPQPELPIWQRGDVRDYARQGAGAIAVLALILFVVRPLLRTLISGRPSEDQPRGTSAEYQGQAALSGEHLAADQLSISSQNDALQAQQHAALPPSAYESHITSARAAVTQDPKRVAQVMKTWLNEDG
ncbi:MAG: fliF [Hydrocarboniphaga sp.]|uniref:flagellar basal-body MS-ring/collar protein FliF n=1 Tax=Hydrocarboniphaga sp. TaxID=2033016 RepID=UPI002625E7B7|nr:flagellar basal-body MS-ring/collar protein FliF [Hydrocarboniphaga sp.]MDB5969845.1 fliF [Hydrocarboniphaga sp.]